MNKEEPMARPDRPRAILARRLKWFVLLWLAGICALGTIAGVLRLWLA